jgi:sphingosine-1-phosphate phosphatase 1
MVLSGVFKPHLPGNAHLGGTRSAFEKSISVQEETMLQDIYVGLIFASFLVVFVLPFVEHTDSLLMSHPMVPLVTIPLSIAGILFYPGSDRWTPARQVHVSTCTAKIALIVAISRGDTTVILGSYLGVHLGVWSNYQLGLLRGPPLPPPYPILWPTYAQYGHTILRMVVGAVVLVATRAIFKPLSYFIACRVMGEDMAKLKAQTADISNKHKICAELTYKFCTYVAIGYNTMFLVPIVFRVMGIERSTFYTEV